MKVKYYKEDDILVIKFSDKPIDHAEEANWVIVHYDENKEIVRIEFLDASRFFKMQGKALPKDIKEKFFTKFV